ncbi:site-specific DNA-methyltransferase [Edaphobacter modestus]|uniref:Adenine-specific DNA-methyltransferase n=1 Tax=Edaphobacter modestus TaxID=388466 RepID=A0A4Q7YVQ0_9BACT|nr:site-specific DNA-methyltransferase [Edaphobacter modestus]RZU41089.1 adenine-specific DNA-methyltransferase [Edaphobacter modestus]
MAKAPTIKTVAMLTHTKASRKNIPTAEFQSVMRTDEQRATRVAYERRNRDLDPQLIWRGKYPDADQGEDDPDLLVPAPPLYIQEKVQPKVLIDELKRQTERGQASSTSGQADLFADFNGLPSEAAKTEFYQHDAHWSNRMILGDSLQVMASLAEREGLRGKVQCIYFDPPYGIKFNSNFQWSTTTRDVKDGNADHITREPEQVKAFRDTWRDGIHSYLTYLRDRFTVARDLLTESGSIFVQIGDENVHRVRALLDEVFGAECCVNQITFLKTSSSTSDYLGNVADYLLWYRKSKDSVKFREPFYSKELGTGSFEAYNKVLYADGTIMPLNGMPKAEIEKGEIIRFDNITSQSVGRDKGEGAASWFPVSIEGREILPNIKVRWKTNQQGMSRLLKAGRLSPAKNSLNYLRKLKDFTAVGRHHIWTDTVISGSSLEKNYVVETLPLVVQRCILMCTDPGDLVLDPTCGSGTTAYVSEQWGRRWITIDTSRVALALARARVMGARYPFYLLADSREGQVKEAHLTGRIPSESPTHGNVRQGFVSERIPHITLKSIANNAEIDVIWQEYQDRLEPLRERLNQALKQNWQEWEIPRAAGDAWPKGAKQLHADWWEERIARQKAIDASIAAKAESEFLYDRPYEDNKKVRVAGPFTVESLSPHRVLAIDENNRFFEEASDSDGDARDAANFVQVILDNLKTSGVQQADKGRKIVFSSLTPWPGRYVCSDGRYLDGDGNEKRAAILIGPEFGTVSRPDLVSAAREAGDAAFDIVIACAFSYDAHSSDFDRLGRIPVLKARMNADLHMAADLKNTGKGNLFVIFGEPDITILNAADGEIQVRVNGVDVFHPGTGEIHSSEAKDIACWFVDTDYNEESFFVRQAYFLGANDPYKALKTTLKAEINEEAWATLHSDTSRPFPKPESGRIAVKVINHLGDEVMKVFKVGG